MHIPKRPKFLSLPLLGLKMSITAKVSILHRVSGVLLVLSIPFLLFILHQSLVSPDFYTVLYGVCSGIPMKVIYILLIWALVHHMCSGVRFLFLDIDKGVSIVIAKRTARLVLLISIILTILLGVVIW